MGQGAKLIVTTNEGLITINPDMIYRAEPSDSSKRGQSGIAGFLDLANYGSLFRLEVAEDVSYKDSQNNTPTMDIAFVTTGWNKKALIINITDISSPAIIKEIDLSDASGSITNVLYNKEHKLLFIIAGGKLYVYELKSLLDTNLQGEPRRIGVYENEDLLYAGSITADSKYLYVGSNKLLVIQYDPLYGLELDEKDKEFPDVKQLPADHYYPALGKKEVWIKVSDGVYQEEMGRIIRDKRDISTAFKDAAGNPVKIAIINDNEDGTKPADCTITGTDTNEPKKSPIEMDTEAQKAHAKFILSCTNLNETEKLTGKIKVLFERGLLRGEGDGGDPDRRKGYVVFTIKTNANVTFAEVRDGKAVYTYDKDTTDTQSKTPSTNNPAIDDNKKFDFIQETFNQVIPRKRNGYNSFDSTTSVQNDYTRYTLKEENGIYDNSAYNAVLDFKRNFKIGVNRKVGNYNPNAPIGSRYSDNSGIDDTSPTFRKLMKDYGKRLEGTGSWLKEDNTPDAGSYLHKVVDKETLIGLNGYQPTDTQVTTGEIITNTGLYELYANVVKKFVNKMIEEGMTYVNTGTSFKDRDGSVRTGESYSFGGNKSLGEFTGKASATRYAPKPFTNDDGYRGNIPEDPGKQYAGLLRDEQRQWTSWFANRSNSCNALGPAYKFYPQYWNGIDCSGFMQRIINVADPEINTGNGLPANLNILVDNLDLYEINCDRRELKYRAWVAYFFNDGPYAGDATYYGIIPDADSEKVKILRNLKKGDLIRYGDEHISMVYSDKSSCDNKTNCTYEIIHAYGVTPYSPPESPEADIFSRKVIKTWNNIRATPTGFGRIKLWD